MEEPNISAINPMNTESKVMDNQSDIDNSSSSSTSTHSSDKSSESEYTMSSSSDNSSSGTSISNMASSVQTKESMLQIESNKHDSNIAEEKIVMNEPIQPKLVDSLEVDSSTRAYQSELRIGNALRGILTLNGRSTPTSWKCGVCAHEEKNSSERCKECKSVRIAPWMFNEEKELIQPGMLVQVNCVWRPIIWKTNSKCGREVRQEPVLAIVTDLRRMNRELEICVLWNSESVAGDESTFQPGLNFEPVIATISPVQSGDQMYLPVKVFCDDPDRGYVGISPRPYFAKFGFCGNAVCGGLYDIVDGDLYGSEEEVKTLKEQITIECAEVTRLKVLKMQHKKVQDFTNVIRVNEDIQLAEGRARAAKWRIVPKQTWCPYCTWESPP